MDLLGFGIIIPLLPLYAQIYKASSLQIGLLLSVYSVCQFISSPILGAISDRYGRRVVLIYSQFGSAVGYLLLGIVMQYHWTTPALALGLFYISRLIDGLSGGNVSTAQAYISDVTTAENRSKGMGVIGAAFGVGFALGPSVGGLLSAIRPYYPGYAAAIASSIAMVLTYLRLPESRQHKPTEMAVWMHPAQIKSILSNSRLTQLLLIVFVSMCGFVMLEGMGALFLSRPDTFNWSPRNVGLYFGYLGLIIMIVQGGLIGRLSKRFGDWPLAIVGPFIAMLGMANLVFMYYHPIFSVLIFFGTLSAAGRSFQTPTLFSLISKNSDRRQQGVVFGVNQGLGSLARAIGPAVGGLIYDHYAAGPFALASALLFAAFLWTLTLSRKRNVPAVAAAEPV
jgi:DHA1 family tetracycline resistance protein-like MFS transporter